MVDVNTLVPKGSTPLYLFFGNDINDLGEIAAYAYDQDNGQFPCCPGGFLRRTTWWD